MTILGRIVILRRALRGLRTLRIPPPGTVSDGIFDPMHIADIVTSLERDGLFTGIRLPQQVVDDLHEFALKTPCCGNLSKKLLFLPQEYKDAQSRCTRPILVGHYMDKIFDCPVVDKIKRDPLLVEIATRYLKTKACLINARMWWSFRVEDLDEGVLTLAAQNLLHFDMDDWSSIKFFFYLTDVDVDSGPHVYLRRSHRRKRLRDQFTIFLGKPVSEVIDFYGRDNLVTICGPAGFGFVEDPFGFHMGTVTQKGPRLVLEIEYGISEMSRRHFRNLVEKDAA